MLALPLPLSALGQPTLAEDEAPAQEEARPEPAKDLRIRCPRAEKIVITSIPSSFHVVLTATNDEGFAFGSFGSIFGDPRVMDFYRAEVSELNDYWRYSCIYVKGNNGVNLQSRDHPAYKDCHFADASQQCLGGTIEDCALICPSGSIPPEYPLPSKL